MAGATPWAMPASSISTNEAMVGEAVEIMLPS
jgi:hypothetical protein